MNIKIKKEEFLVILLNIIIFFIFFMNSFISLVLNLVVIIFSKIKSKYSFYLLVLNLAAINFFRIPHSDYYRYFIRYYDMQNLPLEIFKNQLSRRVDYIFYISKYIFSTNRYSFFTWAFCYSLIVYIFVYLISKKIDPKNRVYIYLLVNPFNITRSSSAMIIAIYGILSISTLKKHLFILLSWLTHKFFMISYLILMLKRIKINIKRINIVLLSVIILILSVAFREKVINIIGQYIEISEKYYNINDLNYIFDLYWIRRTLVQLLSYLIILTVFFDKKNSFISINIIILSILSTISRVVFERYLEFILVIGVILYLKNCKKSKMRNFLIMLIFLKQMIFFVQNIRYGLLTKTYPFNQRILNKDEVLNKIDENGALK